MVLYHVGKRLAPDNGFRDPQALAVIIQLELSRFLLAYKATQPCSCITFYCCNQLRRKRNLLFTSNGWLGTEPLSMRREDVVALIAGLKVPLVLRKKYGGTARDILVGPAFIPPLV